MFNKILSYACLMVFISSAYAGENKANSFYGNLCISASSFDKEKAYNLSGLSDIYRSIRNQREGDGLTSSLEPNSRSTQLNTTFNGNPENKIFQEFLKNQTMTFDREFGFTIGAGYYVNNYYSIELSFSKVPNVNMHLDLNKLKINRDFFNIPLDVIIKLNEPSRGSIEIKNHINKSILKDGYDAIDALLALESQAEILTDMNYKFQNNKVNYLDLKIFDKLNVNFGMNQLLLNNNVDINFLEYKGFRPFLSFGLGVSEISSNKSDFTVDLDKQFVNAEFEDDVQTKSIYALIKEDFEKKNPLIEFPSKSSKVKILSMQIKEQYVMMGEIGLGLKFSASDNIDIVVGQKSRLLPFVKYTFESYDSDAQTVGLPLISSNYYIGVNYFM